MSTDVRKTAIENAIVRVEGWQAQHPQTRYELPRCDDVECRVPFASKPCSHESEFHMPYVHPQIKGVGPFGLKRGKDGAFHWPKATRVKCGVAIPKRTLENIAACAALGLAYWCEHPTTHYVWALDDDRRAHEVITDRINLTSEHACFEDVMVSDLITREVRMIRSPSCPGTGGQGTWTTETEETLPMLTGNALIRTNDPAIKGATRYVEEPGPETAIVSSRDLGDDWTAKKHVPKAKTGTAYDAAGEKTMSRETARALLLHDPDYLGDITNAALVDLLEDDSVRKHHPKIRRELKTARGLTPRKATAS